MSPISQNVRDATEGAECILHRVCSRAFGYRLDRNGGGWTLMVECATEQGWQTCILAVDPAELETSRRDARVRDRLSGAWASRLGAHGIPAS